MSWEFVLPAALTGAAPRQDAAARLSDPPMDSEAFAGFYERSARSLWAYLARVACDPALADDLMQESYVRFLCASRPESILAEGEIAGRRYLFRIATNLLRDHWRRPRPSSLDDVPEESLAAADVAGNADSRVILGPALRQLRPRDRQLLWLAYAEGYSHREIAEITGLASASIRLLLFRARRRIAAALRGQTLDVDCKLDQDPEFSGRREP